MCLRRNKKGKSKVPLADFVYMIQNPSRGTVNYNEISPYFLMGEFCGNGHISHDFPKEKWKFPFPLNFL